MRESTIEKYFVKRAKTEECLTYKFVSPNKIGVPDQILILPGGHTVFVEFKAEDGKLSDAQKRAHKTLRKQGCAVFVINCTALVDELFDWAILRE